MTKKYNVSYEIITDESSRYGDVEEHGIISESDCLRDAVEDVLGGNQKIYSIEPNDNDYRWITAYYEIDPITGDNENRDLYFNTDVSISSRKRIARLMEARI